MMVRNSLMSMIEVEHLPAPGGGFTAGLVTAPFQARVLLRDLANKASWDASALYCSPQDIPNLRKTPKNGFRPLRCNNFFFFFHVNMIFYKLFFKIIKKIFKAKNDEPPMSMLMASIPPRGTLRHRPPHVLPTFQNAAPDMDNLHDLLRCVFHSK